jgi:hypothetical protein
MIIPSGRSPERTAQMTNANKTNVIPMFSVFIVFFCLTA